MSDNPVLRKTCFLISLSLLCLGIDLNAAPASVALVKDGKASSVLVLSKEVFDYSPDSKGKKRRRGRQKLSPEEERNIVEKKAATELQQHLKAMSGAELEIVPAGSDLKGLIPILIGQAADQKLLESVAAKSKDPGAFVVQVTPKAVSLVGQSPQSTLFAAYDLLEQLGVRWYMPGELGTVIPEAKTVSLAVQKTVEVPDFPSRHLQAIRSPEWESRLRSGGMYFPGSHGVHLPKDAGFDKHPEYYALVNGVRKKSQLCVSNPEVVKLATESARNYFKENPDAEIMGIGANDGRGFCECEKCKALDGGDYDPFGHYPSMTDRYVWFFNQILDGIKDEFPNKKLGFYAYSVYNRPPVKNKPNKNLVPAVALITICRIHGMNNPVCPEKSYEKWVIGEWGKLVPEVYYRGYWFNLACPSLPFFMINRIAREVPLGKKLGIKGWRVEAPYNWAGSCPSRYLALKLMWNSDLDVNATLDEFYQKFFGPAAKPMKGYIETVENARDQGDFHTGCSWDMPNLYNYEVQKQAREYLEQAKKLAPKDSIYAKRIYVYDKAWEYFEAFANMMASRDKFDFVTAKTNLDKMHEIRKEMWAYKPPMLSRKAESYLKRFFQVPVEQGYERTTGKNKMLVGFNDEWDFLIDPEQVGEAIGWWNPEYTGGNWQKIKAYSNNWSAQGLRYYKGLAWYKQTVDVPASAKGKRVFLWIGAYDEGAKVWLNGKEVGIAPKLTFKPCEFDVTKLVEPGKPNTLVICVKNDVLNEVGTGGIMGPVMLYLPEDGREPKNLKPYGKTFPEY